MNWLSLSLPLVVTSLAAAQEPAPGGGAPTDAPTLVSPTKVEVPATPRLLPEGTEVPYRGGAVPRGARVLGRKNVPLLVGGAAAFGLGYAGALVGAWVAGFGPALDARQQGGAVGPPVVTGALTLLPLAGPGAAVLVDPTLQGKWLLPALVDVALQVAGAVLLGAAIFGPVERLLHYDQAGPAPEPEPGEAPAAPRTTPG